jgi:hypothetical protein
MLAAWPLGYALLHPSVHGLSPEGQAAKHAS